MKNYQEMTVPELREECKKRNIPRQEDGRKLVKQELINRLEWNDESRVAKPVATKVVDVPKKKHVTEETKEERVTYAKDIIPKLKALVEKYEGTCDESKITAGVHVIYVRYIETRTGKIIQKLSTAQVTNTKRASHLAKIETPVGTSDTRDFSEFLFVRSSIEEQYPDDIIEVLALQRKERQQYLNWRNGATA